MSVCVHWVTRVLPRPHTSVYPQATHDATSAARARVARLSLGGLDVEKGAVARLLGVHEGAGAAEAHVRRQAHKEAAVAFLVGEGRG